MQQVGAETRTTRYEYDVLTNKNTVYRPEGVIEETKFDSIGNKKAMTTIVRGVGQTTKYDYDGLKNITQMTDAEGNTQRFLYDSLGHLTNTIRTDGRTGDTQITQTQFDNLGRKTKTIDAKGQEFTTTYDAVGNVKTQTENGARTTKYEYDVVNRLTDTNIQYGSATTNTHTEYDAVGNVKSSRDAENHTTRYEYDAVNRRILVIDAKNQKTKTDYDEVGNVTKVITDPFGTPHQMVYGYDALNRRNNVTDAEGIITHTTFNEFGNVISVTQNYTGTETRTTQYKYDKLGRRIEVIDPANHSTQTKYDEAGNVIGVIDANQNQTSYYYDRLNRQTESVDANNIRTQETTYDGFGNVRKIKDSGNNVTEYDYDELNRQIKMIDPRGKSVTQDYDALGRVEWVVDRNNRRRDFDYDINDNLTKEVWGNGIQLQFIYDKVGNLKQSIDGASNTSNIYNYDAIYQLTDATTGNVNFHYDYDVYGDLIKRQERVNGLQTVTLDYQYDKNHQLKQLSQSGLGVTSQVMEFGYDRLNQLTNISRATANSSGALVTDYQYNEVGLLKDINNYFVKPTVVNPITTISNYHYDYDAGNRLTLKSGTDGNSVIDYGKDNQLKSVDNSSRADEVYNFNALGIRNNWSTVTGDSRQILNDGKYVYKYDDEGNLQEKKELVSGKITNYEWDYRNRLTKVSNAGQTVEYQYDAEDRRVGKVINGVTKEKYFYDGQDIALVVNSAGTITERYLYGSGVDNVLSREANGQVTWSLGDKQGSIVDLVNERGEVVNHFVYDSFGNRTEATTADFRFGYTGRELDTETGLYYYRARYYDAAIGRFISEDPIGFSAGDTNLYRYVFNNATNYTDPSGKIFFLPLLAVLGVGFLAGAGINTVKQGLEIAEGSRKEFSTGEVFTSGAFGAIAAPVLILAPELAIPFALKGLVEGAYNVTHGKPLSGAFDIVTSVLPFASSKVRSQSIGEGTLFGQFRGLGNSASRADRISRLTNIEAFDKFHGITAEYQVSSFRGLSQKAETYSQVTSELPQAAFGHVGFSFNSGKKIYGFGPSVKEMSSSQAYTALRARQQFNGILTNDTSMFATARTLGLNVLEQRFNVGLLRYWTARTQSRIQEQFGTPVNTKYMLPPKGSDINGNPIPFPKNCYNCATYPDQMLNLPTSSPTGHLSRDL